VVDSTAPTEEYSGTVGATVGGSLPEWKSNLHTSYSWGDVSVGLTWRYVDSMHDVNLELVPVFDIPSENYFDFSADYEFSSGMFQGLRLGFGVENVTDEDPPIFPSYVQANTDPSQYDVFGRRYYASIRYVF
jgi:outer membrane receptor protein involved in Fe transport